MNESPATRRERLTELRKTKTLQEIADIEGVTRSRIGQLTPNLGRRAKPILLEVHEYIREYQRKYFTSPTLEEIGCKFPGSHGKRSNSVVANWLRQMEARKMIAPRTPGARRTIRTLPIRKQKGGE